MKILAALFFSIIHLSSFDAEKEMPGNASEIDLYFVEQLMRHPSSPLTNFVFANPREMPFWIPMS